MSRELTSHQVNGANETLKIKVVDEPGSGGACHRYDVTGFNIESNPSRKIDNCNPYTRLPLIFQNGPIKEAGVNGITHEVLLAVLIDRLTGYQSGQFGCDENAEALKHLEAAQAVLKSRTEKRLARGVEGTHEK